MATNTHLQLQDYDVQVFQQLSDFFVARDDLERHRSNITQLGDIICNYDMEQYLAVNLLHKHFEITNDELVVREFVGDTAYMKPGKIEEYNTVVPYLWKLADGRKGKGFYPLEFIAITDSNWMNQSHSIIETINQKEDFLDSLAAKLEELGLVELFGIAALFSRKPFVLDEKTSLLETTDEANRVLTLKPAPKSEIKSTDTTQTLWIFTPPPDKQLSPESQCVGHCISHCHNHCVNHNRSVISSKKGESR